MKALAAHLDIHPILSSRAIGKFMVFFGSVTVMAVGLKASLAAAAAAASLPSMYSHFPLFLPPRSAEPGPPAV